MTAVMKTDDGGNGKRGQRSRTGFLPNLEASHCQPIYEAN